MHEPKGQFNRPDGPFAGMSIEKVYEIERDWCTEHNVTIPVHLKELVECAAYKGNMDNIWEHCFNLDWEHQKREEIESRSAESSRGSRASGSPCKPGEDEVEKRRAELAKRDKTKLYGQYTNWCNLVKAWFRKTHPLPTDATPKPGDKKLKQGPWEKSKARMLELETEKKKLKGAIIKLRRCSESQSNGSSDTVRQETLQESIAEVAFLKQKLTESNKLKIEMEQQGTMKTARLQISE